MPVTAMDFDFTSTLARIILSALGPMAVTTVMLAITFGMMVAPAFVRIIPSAAPAAAATATVTVVIGEPQFKRAASPPVAGATLLRPTVL